LARIPEETLQTIRDRTDLVDLVGRHVALKKAGRTYKGLCPFHHEKTPSFQVNPERGIYHCFGCNESGNAFAFVMKVEGLTFPEAVRTLAAGCGVEIPESGRDDGGQHERRLTVHHDRIGESVCGRHLVACEEDGGHGDGASMHCSAPSRPSDAASARRLPRQYLP